MSPAIEHNSSKVLINILMRLSRSRRESKPRKCFKCHKLCHIMSNCPNISVRLHARDERSAGSEVKFLKIDGIVKNDLNHKFQSSDCVTFVQCLFLDCVVYIQFY